MKMFLASDFLFSGSPIREVEIQKKTEKCVYLGNRRKAIHSEGESFFDTYEEAKAHLLQKQMQSVSSAKSRYERELAKLKRFEKEL